MLSYRSSLGMLLSSKIRYLNVETSSRSNDCIIQLRRYVRTFDTVCQCMFNNIGLPTQNYCVTKLSSKVIKNSQSFVGLSNSNQFFTLAKPGLTNELVSIQQRYKSTKKGEKRPEYDSDSDSDEEEENIQGTKVITLRMQSLRLDGVLKKSLAIARNKAETAFYEGRLRVNGQKPDKKSFQVRVEDEVDLIRGVSPTNPDFLSISRIEVLSVRESEEGGELLVKVRRTKTMVIENYSKHPWKRGTPSE